MVKLAKRAIVAVIGNADITDEELQSTFAGVECDRKHPLREM